MPNLNHCLDCDKPAKNKIVIDEHSYYFLCDSCASKTPSLRQLFLWEDKLVYDRLKKDRVDTFNNLLVTYSLED